MPNRVEWLDIFLVVLALALPLFTVQYLLIVRPAKKRIDIWLKQQDDKNKKG